MADVFVSYAHNTFKRVQRICENLEQAGFSLWWDTHLKAGDDFPLVIERELKDAGCVVVAWSEAARNSLWVRAEATEALDDNKLAQVRLDGVKPPLPFTVVEMLDLTHWRGGRGEAPWPRVEMAARALAGGNAPPLEPQVFTGPALQDMGSTVRLGWLSLGLIVFVSALTLQLGPGGLDPQLYGVLSAASFAVACVALAATLLRVIQTALASVQS